MSEQQDKKQTRHRFLDRPLADYYLVLISSTLLIGLGLVMVLSASTPYAAANPAIHNQYAFVGRQAVFLLAGIVVTWWLSRRSPAFLMRFGWIGIAIAIALLTSIAFLALRSSGGAIGDRGNTNWLSISSQLAIQPSEFAKLALVLWAAEIFTKQAKVLDQPRWLLVPFIPIGGLVIVLVLVGKDLGTAMVMGFIMFSLLWFVGAPMKVLGSLGILAATGVAVLAATSANRMTRIMVWLGLQSGTGVEAQPRAALYALASGGWWGVGLGAGKQKWGNLKDGAHTDFIFAVIGEELGLIGVLLVLGLFAVLGYAGIRIALRSDHIFTRVLAAGLTSWLMIQAFINIMVVLNLLPVLGIPLPFTSYGGSALIANMMGLGMLMVCARYEPDARKARAARKDRKGRRGPKVARLVDVGSRR